MTASPWRRMLLVSAVLGSLLLAPVPAYAGSTSNGTWEFAYGPDICTFSGHHFGADGTAFAQTRDRSGTCRNLLVRLKYRATSGTTWITGWKEGTGSGVTVWGNYPGVAVASEHRAQVYYASAWSPVRRPHAW